MNISDYLTHIDNKEDKPFLKTPLFDVNIRLFISNQKYNQIIMDCCELISFCAVTKMDGYKLPHGMSGANVGIPFNIIGIVKNRGQSNAYCEIMINPKILKYQGKKVESLSNCGSIRLEKPIKIKRWPSILIEWFDTKGIKKVYDFVGGSANVFTIQHEVDHNLGILITDRQK